MNAPRGTDFLCAPLGAGSPGSAPWSGVSLSAAAALTSHPSSATSSRSLKKGTANAQCECGECERCDMDTDMNAVY